MKAVDIEQATAQLPQLIEVAAGGEEIIITKSGTPLARLCSFKAPKRRQLGLLNGKLHLPEDLVAPLPERHSE